MALTNYNEPVFKTVRVESFVEVDDDDYEVAWILGTLGVLVFLGCVAFTANRWMANVG